MSMINDALRRASDAAKSGPGVPPMPVSPRDVPLPPPSPTDVTAPVPPPLPPSLMEAGLPPAPPLNTEPTRKSSRLQIILALLLVFCVGIAAAMNFWEKKSHAAKPVQLTLVAKKIIASEAITANNATKPAPVPAFVAPSNPAPAPAPKIVAAATSTAATPAVVPALPPVKFPPLRLQSIFYRPSNPSVLINGKTLYLSDEIQGVTVADISSASVTLVLSGQTNVLTLR